MAGYRSKYFWTILIFGGVFYSCQRVNEPDLSIACSANMQFAMEQLVLQYERQSGQQVHLTISSSGKLFAQIREGAPWDIFFSADKKYPLELNSLGIGVDQPRTYARGKLVLLSRKQSINEDMCAWLASKDGKIAIANPRTAPYGKAAQSFLSKCEESDNLSKRLVYGESISQVNRFFLTGAVDLALTAQSILYSDKFPDTIHAVHISTHYYAPIAQDYLILNASSAVQQFINYLQSSEGQNVLESYGYYKL